MMSRILSITILKFNRIKEAYVQKNIFKYDFMSPSRKIKN